MDLLRHGRHKFPQARLLASSQGLGWRGIAAELRSHPAGDIAAIQPDQVEVTIAITGTRDAIVSRKGAGQRQDTPVHAGQIWISPVGVVEDDIRITQALPEILHLYLPTQPPPEIAAALGGPGFGGDSLRYLAGVQDELLRQAAMGLRAEMLQPTAAGRLLAESLAQVLTIRLLQQYTTGATRTAQAMLPSPPRSGRLDAARLHRVLDYMHAHLEQDIGLDDLAAAAHLSPFHFARMFRATTGQPPHRYLAQLRLETARRMLALGDLPVAQIAAACCFSSQANFSRAFKLATGMAPGAWRRAQRVG